MKNYFFFFTQLVLISSYQLVSHTVRQGEITTTATVGRASLLRHGAYFGSRGSLDCRSLHVQEYACEPPNTQLRMNHYQILFLRGSGPWWGPGRGRTSDPKIGSARYRTGPIRPYVFMYNYSGCCYHGLRIDPRWTRSSQTDAFGGTSSTSTHRSHERICGM